jgi:hypothetical protein
VAPVAPATAVNGALVTNPLDEIKRALGVVRTCVWGKYKLAHRNTLASWKSAIFDLLIAFPFPITKWVLDGPVLVLYLPTAVECMENALVWSPRADE